MLLGQSPREVNSVLPSVPKLVSVGGNQFRDKRPQHPFPPAHTRAQDDAREQAERSGVT